MEKFNSSLLKQTNHKKIKHPNFNFLILISFFVIIVVGIIVSYAVYSKFPLMPDESRAFVNTTRVAIGITGSLMESSRETRGR